MRENIFKTRQLVIIALIIASFVVATILLNSPNLTGKKVAFGYGGGGGVYYVDTTPPTNASIKIVTGAVSPATTAVNLTLSATDAYQMMVSNSSDFAGATWESYVTSKAWTLTSGDGVKTVYAKFRDSASNVSTAVSDSITFTTTTTITPAPTTPTTTTTPTVTTPTTTTVTPAAPTAVTAVPTAPVTIPALPAAPTTSDIVNVLSSAVQQVAYIQANLTAPNALVLLLEVAQRISQIQTALAVTPQPIASTVPSVGSYVTALYLGSKGDDVTALQNFLKSQGVDVYPEGLVTGYFGPLTKVAVGRFQFKYGLVSSPSDAGYGYVGPKTRAKINSLLGL